MTPSSLATRAAGIALLLAAGAPQAQQFYKWVDAQGNVTYSSIPPPDPRGSKVQEIQIQAEPSESQRQEAHERQRAQESSTQSGQDAKAEEDKRRAVAVAEAQQALIRAKAELEQAKIQDDGDWQHLAKGGRVLRPDYFDRVAAAEAKVEEAERMLAKAKERH